MEKHFTAAIPQEWIGQKVKVLTSLASAFEYKEIKGSLSEIGMDYIIVDRDVINIRHVVKIRKA
ncbi:hypothetical protein ES707_10539 [subsurface metagenome]